MAESKLIPRLVFREERVKSYAGKRPVYFPHLDITATAATMGITVGFLSTILSGRNKPGLATACKLALAFETTVEKITEITNQNDTVEYTRLYHAVRSSSRNSNCESSQPQSLNENGTGQSGI